MTVAVVYATTPTSRLALVEAVSEAKRRGEDLAVLHVAGSPDAQLDAYRRGILEQILGSTAQSVVLGATSPVLVVKAS